MLVYVPRPVAPVPASETPALVTVLSVGRPRTRLVTGGVKASAAVARPPTPVQILPWEWLVLQVFAECSPEELRWRAPEVEVGPAGEGSAPQFGLERLGASCSWSANARCTATEPDTGPRFPKEFPETGVMTPSDCSAPDAGPQPAPLF